MDDGLKEIFKNVIESLKKKYPKKEIDIEFELENAINIYRGLKQDNSISIFNDYEKNWIRRCTVELLERKNRVNIESYSEIGFSFSYFSDLISDSLKREIFPKVKSF